MENNMIEEYKICYGGRHQIKWPFLTWVGSRGKRVNQIPHPCASKFDRRCVRKSHLLMFYLTVNVPINHTFLIFYLFIYTSNGEWTLVLVREISPSPKTAPLTWASGAARQYKSTGNLLRIQKGPTTWFPNSHFPVTLRRWLQADTIIRLYTDRQAKTENHFRFC